MANIKLENFEALVLVDFLLRFTDTENLSFKHEAEKQILYDLCALLESEVPELLDPNYKKLLEEARKKIIACKHY